MLLSSLLLVASSAIYQAQAPNSVFVCVDKTEYFQFVNALKSGNSGLVNGFLQKSKTCQFLPQDAEYKVVERHPNYHEIAIFITYSENIYHYAYTLPATEHKESKRKSA